MSKLKIVDSIYFYFFLLFYFSFHFVFYLNLELCYNLSSRVWSKEETNIVGYKRT